MLEVIAVVAASTITNYAASVTQPALEATPTTPVIPMGFVSEGVVLRYFSMVTTVGAPQHVAAQELRVECMFPADDETEARHLRLLAAEPIR